MAKTKINKAKGVDLIRLEIKKNKKKKKQLKYKKN